MYTVRDAFKFCYPLIWQAWASYAVWPNQFLYLMNHAINMIYNYEGMHWTRQHRKDLFNMNWQSQGALLSRRPVRKIDKFRTAWWKDIDKIWLDSCYCNMNLPDKVIWACCECSCPLPCKPLDLMEILPQNNLCANSYQISWSYVPGMWGLDWRIVKVDTGNTPINDLRMTYFCGPIKMEKFDDIVPLPDSFMHVLWWIIAALVIPMTGAWRQQEDLSYYKLYRNELDYLRKHDTIVPESIDVSDIWLPWQSNNFTSIGNSIQW